MHKALNFRHLGIIFAQGIAFKLILAYIAESFCIRTWLILGTKFIARGCPVFADIYLYIFSPRIFGQMSEVVNTFSVEGHFLKS